MNRFLYNVILLLISGDGIAKKLDQKLADYLGSGGGTNFKKNYKDLHQVNTDCLTHPTPKKRVKKSFSVGASVTPSVCKFFIFHTLFFLGFLLFLFSLLFIGLKPILEH